ncbi:MAG: hypothetical protein JNM76_08215 [Betaproteobacteria bacterium]|nr:hypothetical protein [Betaproteobacteria bacterium]
MSVAITSGEEHAHFMRVVERMGYGKDDFEVMESSQGDVTRSVAVRKKRVSLTVTRKSKAITREYRGGPGSKWSANAEWELMQGLFGPP